jgi:hypothetical protein
MRDFRALSRTRTCNSNEVNECPAALESLCFKTLSEKAESPKELQINFCDWTTIHISFARCNFHWVELTADAAHVVTRTQPSVVC